MSRQFRLYADIMAAMNCLAPYFDHPEGILLPAVKTEFLRMAE